MKKLIAFLFAIIIMANIQAYAAGIEVLPTFGAKTNAQDRVWVGTFQLVWNDFINKIVFNPIRFREGTPAFVYDLNKQEFTADDISEASCYRYVGKVKKNTKKQIAKAIKRKFKETSDILDKLNLTPRNDMFLVYAMLKKDFEFVREFDKLEHSTFGKNEVAQYFGINKDSNSDLDKGVEVVFYNDSTDYAVKLLTKGKDEIFLYKNSSNKPFNYLYADMLKKEKFYKGNKDFKKVDELKVPNIKFFEEKNFEELANKRIMGTNMVINQAIETIKFDMNNIGVKLKSEAAMTVMTTA